MKGEPGRGGEGEGAPRGQDDSAAGRKVAVAARRRSARPTPARRGPWAAAAAAGGPRAMSDVCPLRRCRFSDLVPAVSGYLRLVLHLWVRLASGKY
jgi:hypothetical protein